MLKHTHPCHTHKHSHAHTNTQTPLAAFTHTLCTYVSSVGHSEKAFDRFAVTPDNEHVVFLGKDGYMIFLSGRVRATKGTAHTITQELYTCTVL